AVVRDERQIAEASRETSVRKDEQQTQSVQMQAESQAAASRAVSPALGGAVAKSAGGNVIARPQWRDHKTGRPRRTLGSGGCEPLVPSEQDRMHIVSVISDTVWAGGENDVLYRTQNEGLTWQKVALPEKNGSAHVIAHIRFVNAATGTIEAEDGTSWS